MKNTKKKQAPGQPESNENETGDEIADKNLNDPRQNCPNPERPAESAEKNKRGKRGRSRKTAPDCGETSLKVRIALKCRLGCAIIAPTPENRWAGTQTQDSFRIPFVAGNRPPRELSAFVFPLFEARKDSIWPRNFLKRPKTLQNSRLCRFGASSVRRRNRRRVAEGQRLIQLRKRSVRCVRKKEQHRHPVQYHEGSGDRKWNTCGIYRKREHKHGQFNKNLFRFGKTEKAFRTWMDECLAFCSRFFFNFLFTDIDRGRCRCTG